MLFRSDEFFDSPFGGNRLQLALELERRLVARKVVHEHQATDPIGSVYLGDQGRGWKLADAVGEVQVDFADPPHRPTTGDGDSHSVSALPFSLMNDRELIPEKLARLVAAIAHDDLLQRYEIGSEIAEAIGEHGPTSVPVLSGSPDIQRHNAHG